MLLSSTKYQANAGFDLLFQVPFTGFSGGDAE